MQCCKALSLVVTSGLLLFVFQLAAQFLSRKIQAGQQARKVTACYTKFQEQVFNPTSASVTVIQPEEPDPHHAVRMGFYQVFREEMARLRENETARLSHKQKEALFGYASLMDNLLKGTNEPLDRCALPIFKEVLERASKHPYIKRHGFRLAKCESDNP